MWLKRTGIKQTEWNRLKQKKTTKQSPKEEFEKSWKEYNVALKVWKETLTKWQKATNETLITYHEACQKALDSDAELLKKVRTSWQETWDEIGPEYVKQQTKMIESIFKETNIENIKKFNEQWEKFLKTSGEESIKAYQEAIKKFNEVWRINTIWN